jgi:nucleoid DNA-binding protein
VFDLWVEAWRQKVAKGEVIVVRYADDLVVGFEYRTDAEQFLKAFQERLSKFGLEVNAEKTRLIEFGRFAIQNRQQRGQGKPDTFTFLGFTHYCGKRKKDGTFIVRRKTVRKRMVAKLRLIQAELRYRMHEPVASVGDWVQKVVSGYYRYHAVPGNLNQLRVFGQRLRRLWYRILCRRSQKAVPWGRVLPIFDRWIPEPRVLHPYPMQRFFATHPR